MIDGDISDPVWSKATRIDKFYQIEPVLGAEPSEITVVYIAFDENQPVFRVFIAEILSLTKLWPP